MIGDARGRIREQAAVRLLALPVLGAVAALVLYRFDPASSSIYPPCLFRALTGWLCPGCGSLRGVHQLLHGHVAAALRLNSLTMISLPIVCGVWIADAVRGLRGEGPFITRIPPWAIWLFAALTGAFWLLRNLPL